MPNAIKYNVSAETLALKKGNFWIGTGDVGKGPTSSTGFYNGITPPSGGYTIYLNKETGGPSIYTVTTEAQMVSLTNSIGSQSFTTSGQCLNWFATQTDKMIFNIDYPAIVTNGLLLNFDAAFTPSYPTTGTTLYDTSSFGKNGTLANGPTFSSANGGGIVLDGTDDTYSITGISLGTSAFTLDCWFKYQDNSLYYPAICFAGDYPSGDSQTGWGFGQNGTRGDYRFQMTQLGSQIGVTLSSMVDGTIYNFVGTRTISGSQQILRGYVNGSLVGSVTGNTIFNLSTSTFGYTPTILKPQQYYASGPNPPPATLYNIKVYTRDLSATEISQNYEAIGTRYTTFSVQYLVIGGGGGPGMGGGGAGGYLESTTTSLTTQTNYKITVGGGGPGFASGSSGNGTKGSDSVFATLTATGGGYGGNGGASSGPGGPGGSGGGGGGYSGGQGGAGNTPSTSPSQGNNGGDGNNVAPQGSGWLGGGGGGAGGVGGTFISTTSGNGGAGKSSSITGSAVSRAGGGAGGGNAGSRGTATSGGGNVNTSGTINTGGGGGGRNWNNPGGAGGSGVVILKIPDVYNANFSSGVSFTKSTSVSGYKIYTITATSTTSETVSFS